MLALKGTGTKIPLLNRNFCSRSRTRVYTRFGSGGILVDADDPLGWMIYKGTTETTMTLKNKFVAPLVIALGFLPGLARATPISGDFSMGGSATVTAVSLDFFCGLGVCPGTAGDFTVSP